MTMDAEAHALVAQLVDALRPLTNCNLHCTFDPPRLLDEHDQRAIPFALYDKADTAVVAAKAALAATAGQ